MHNSGVMTSVVTGELYSVGMCFLQQEYVESIFWLKPESKQQTYEAYFWHRSHERVKIIHITMQNLYRDTKPGADVFGILAQTALLGGNVVATLLAFVHWYTCANHNWLFVDAVGEDNHRLCSYSVVFK